MDSKPKPQSVRAGRRPERKSAGSYSFKDDNRVDRVAPGRAPAQAAPAGPLVSSRPRTITSDIARLNLCQLGQADQVPDNDAGAGPPAEGRPLRESADRMMAPMRPPATTRAVEAGELGDFDEDTPRRPLRDSLPEMQLPPALPMQEPPTAKTMQPPTAEPERPHGRSERRPAATVQLEPGWESEFDESTGEVAPCLTVPAPAPASDYDPDDETAVKLELSLPDFGFDGAAAAPADDPLGLDAEDPEAPLTLEPFDVGGDPSGLDFETDEPTATVGRPERPSLEWTPEPSPVTTARNHGAPQAVAPPAPFPAPGSPTQRDAPAAPIDPGQAPPAGPASVGTAERELPMGLGDAVSRGDWAEVRAQAEEAAADADAHPVLVLLDAVARQELSDGAEADTAQRQRATRAMGRLAQVDADGPIARLLADRVLRAAPPAPQPQTKSSFSVLTLLAGLALGSGAGWLVTQLLF